MLFMGLLLLVLGFLFLLRAKVEDLLLFVTHGPVSVSDPRSKKGGKVRSSATFRDGVPEPCQ